MSNLIGKTIGDYQLIEFINRGALSWVYKGFQPTLNRYVAVKVLSPSFARKQENVDAFLRQGRLMGQLDHPNILPVYDAGSDEGRHFIASRFIEGGTSIRSRLDEYRNPLPAQRLLNYVADGLDYVQGLGHFHGNLRPSNVLLAGPEQPLLTDFAFGNSTRPTNVYSAPELAQGGPVDHRVDVYALGVMLYEMLVGEPPEPGRLPSPRLKRPDLPEDVEKVILKAMAKYPAQRFESAGAFSQALGQAVRPLAQAMPATAAPVVERKPAGTPAPTAPPEVTYAAPQSKSPGWINGCLTAMLIGLLLLIAGASVYLLFFKVDDSADVIPPTPLPGMATLTSTADLNVRSGPGEYYEVIGLMRQGQSAEVIGSSPDSQWWVIRFPAVASQQGWVNARYADVENASNVPIVQPPPLPTLPSLEPTVPPMQPIEPTLPAVQPTLPLATFPPVQPTLLPEGSYPQ